jgi:GTP cyclohydrolase I
LSIVELPARPEPTENARSRLSNGRVRVPDENRLADARSFRDTARVLATTRTTCAWMALGHATAGYDGDPKLRTAFPAERPDGLAGVHSQVVEGPISFFSLCEHHALPFHGSAHVAYIANGEILGISKLTRLVRLYARRFTVQERLGEQIADRLLDLVAPRGVAVHIEAAHLCTQMRGVEEEGSRTVTTFWRGLYDEDADLRREFLDEVRSHRGA